MSESPSISVFIPIYTDNTLYKEAISSVMRQNYPLSKVEVVLCSSFPHDYDIPRSTDDGVQVKIIETKERSGAGKLKKHARSCSGDIIAFLDYDDIWESNKLASVVRAFTEISGLGYYHNDCTFVHRNQVPQVGMYRNIVKSLLYNIPAERTIDPATASAVEMLSWMGPGTYNASSIALTRDTLLAFSDDLPRVNYSTEDIVFAHCIDLNKKGKQDPGKLTRVRMHDANVTNASNRTRESTLDDNAVEYLVNLMNRTSNKELNKCLNSYVMGKKLFSRISIEPGTRKAVIREALNYLSSYRKSGIVPSPVLTSMAAVYAISPSIYTKLQNKRFRNS